MSGQNSAGEKSAPLYTPSSERIAAANLTAFSAALETDWGKSLPVNTPDTPDTPDTPLYDYKTLHDFSIREMEEFWRSLWTFCGVLGEPGDRVLEHADRMPGARWFPDARLNFAENLLRRRDDAPALIFQNEMGHASVKTYAELYDDVSRLRQFLIQCGVSPGNRVAGFLPNLPETVIAMLATTSLGAIWSSCSPDFGSRGVIDRFGQIEPVLLFTADAYFYNGKTHDSLARAIEICAAIPSIENLVVIPYCTPEPDLSGITLTSGASGTSGTSGTPVTLEAAMEPFDAGKIEFERFPFDHPIYILYSSGTTGAPKCIVHGAGGTLLQHLKEHQLHADIRPNDRVFYFTTCGWMMWNWLVSALASQATLLLFDGSPYHPDGNVLFDFAENTRANVFGVSAKFIDTLAKEGLEPAATHDLTSMRMILSTGSPLAPESFDFVYEKVRSDLILASMSGGTDIVACFVCGNPTGKVWRGEIQAKALGMDVAVYNDNAEPVRGEKGELVCRSPFPSMPVGFFGDTDGSRYKAAYFEKYPGVWCQGDFAEFTEHDGMIIHGRSDAVLNPGGVRIGTAEIYRQVEQLEEVEEGIVVGQDWQGDVRVVLFVKLAAGVDLDEALIGRIRRRIREGCTPRHVPAKVLAVADIPRTKSGKIVELAVRDVVHGREVKNKEALANPEALELYAGRAELES